MTSLLLNYLIRMQTLSVQIRFTSSCAKMKHHWCISWDFYYRFQSETPPLSFHGIIECLFHFSFSQHQQKHFPTDFETHATFSTEPNHSDQPPSFFTTFTPSILFDIRLDRKDSRFHWQSSQSFVCTNDQEAM